MRMPHFLDRVYRDFASICSSYLQTLSVEFYNIQQTGWSFSSKSLDPIFDSSLRVPIQTSRITGIGSVQDMQYGM